MEYFNVSTGNNNSKRNAGMFCERMYTNNEEKRDFVFHKMEVMNRLFQQKNAYKHILSAKDSCTINDCNNWQLKTWWRK